MSLKHDLYQYQSCFIAGDLKKFIDQVLRFSVEKHFRKALINQKKEWKKWIMDTRKEVTAEGFASSLLSQIKQISDTNEMGNFHPLLI